MLKFTQNVSVSILVLAALISGCRSGTTSTTVASTETPLTVETQTLALSLASNSTDYTATVKARRQAVLSTKLSGKIVFLTVEVGDIVAAGSVVVQVDTSDMLARTRQAQAGRVTAVAGLAQTEAGYRSAQQAVSQARAQLEMLRQQRGEAEANLGLARQDSERYQLLAKEGAVSRQQAEHAASALQVAQSHSKALESQILAAEVAVRQAQAAVAQAQTTIAVSQAGIGQAAAGVETSQSDLPYGEIKAPFRGVVVEKNAFQGELNTPGRPLLKLEDLDSLEVSLALPEAALEGVKVGAVFPAEIPSLGRRVDLKVRQVVASTDPASRTVEIRLTLMESVPSLFSGTFVRVSLPQSAHQMLLLPDQAFVIRGQLEGAFVVGSSGTAEFRLLQLGAAQVEGGREVLSGLQAGEVVILSPGEGLVDGRNVSPR